ncbi:tRNA(Ser) Um(44) 2'-O-methyltransferase [Tulasnella sp. 330]|nr:tRNA(Ser) Um(44) 2'-O-methyltransferase [Tulasnella sp. 330]KAG8885014.1 tRNA(Ser) Um(44) 2'-O-methyltransferase [Tulasnella sp. 331]KAG8890913.1 tRNA(Ser) Um(44) 2'-O-methyltransferase [Tulasnella sp. 332]
MTRQIPFEVHTSNDTPPGELNGTLQGSSAEWKSVLSCFVEFSAIDFYSALDDIIKHPEYNSSIILRADILGSTTSFPTDETSPLSIDGFVPIRQVTRRIMPRRPDRDGSLEQDCVFFKSSEPTADIEECIVVLVPRLRPGATLPFYHPDVSAIAFRHQTTADHGRHVLTVFVIPPFPSTRTSERLTRTSRLHRICTSLAESIWRIGYGKMTGYQKKVEHDVILDKSEYQDFYLFMRERHKSIVQDWKLDTDPLKHVFEDIGIATFIILLWKHSYPSVEASSGASPSDSWTLWGRPPGGFVDLGEENSCGNGLLTHILVTMGYTDGIGIDLRARKTWDDFPTATRSHLHVIAIDPTSISSSDTLPSYLRRGGFLIGNHCDELTPWLPILATLSDSSFLSIPCCPWALDSRFSKPKGFHKRVKTPSEEALERKLEARGTGGAKSLYGTYLAWHFREGINCGFDVETEALRIPSSRAWAIIGRKHLEETTQANLKYEAYALNEIARVRDRGIFKTRIPEGKAGGGHR